MMKFAPMCIYIAPGIPFTRDAFGPHKFGPILGLTRQLNQTKRS
jgi:hypothetical protein